MDFSNSTGAFLAHIFAGKNQSVTFGSVFVLISCRTTVHSPGFLTGYQVQPATKHELFQSNV